jgi:release factor glutamine methyltransferase
MMGFTCSPLDVDFAIVAPGASPASITDVVSSKELLTGLPVPPREAVRLLAKATGRDPGEVRMGVTVDVADLADFRRLIERRVSGEPLQYLEGEVQFGPIMVAVDRRVLIPRPETEYLYDLAVRSLPPPKVVVDLCTGSGALALALKATYPGARIVASDLSGEALELAMENGRRLGLEVEWRVGDLWGPIPSELAGSVNLMVANPPYVAEAEWDQLPIDVQQEPRMALVAGPAGTEVIERLLDQTPGWLAEGGVALVEVGESQAWPLSEMRDEIEVLIDQYDRPRFLKLGR